jgi:hypothetical protein
MSERNPDGADKEKLTGVGCVLTTLSLAVTIGAAVPIVLWRDSTGQPLPHDVALYSPLLIGAAFHGIGTGILWLVGLRVFSKPEKDETEWPGA